MQGKVKKGFRRLLQRPRVSKVHRPSFSSHSHADSPLHRISRRRLYLQQQPQTIRRIQHRYQTRSVTALLSTKQLLQRDDTPIADFLGEQAMSNGPSTSSTTSQQSQQQRSTTTAAAAAAASSAAATNAAAMTNSASPSSAAAAAQAHAQQKQQQQNNSSPLQSFNAAGFPQNYAPNSYFAYVAEVRRRLGKDDGAISSGFLHEPEEGWDAQSTSKQSVARR